MKIPLRYQISEFDSGSVSVLNCLTYLFDREEIPTELIRVISTYSLTYYDVKGKLDLSNNQKSLHFYVSAWVNKFALQKQIPLKSQFLYSEYANIHAIVNCLKMGGCVNVKLTKKSKPCYVAITAIDDEYVYLFDPEFELAWDYKNSKTVEVIEDNPFAFNRRVALEQFLSERTMDYSLGSPINREIVLLYRSDVHLEREFG